MKQRDTFLAAAVGFAGGLAAGVFLSTEAGATLRRRVERQVSGGARRVEQQLQDVERQLRDLEQALRRSRVEFGARIQAGVDSGLAPSFGEDDWSLDRGEVDRELKHLPK